MPIVLNPPPPPLDPALVEALGRLSFPTIGHFLETGFMSPEIRSVTPGHTFVGRAVTARIPAPDGVLLHRVVAGIEPGDVLVIETGSNRTHAVLGAVIATAAQVAGAVGAVVDGVVTDVVELRAMGLPVLARGTSLLTAKQLGTDDGGLNVPVTCGGAPVRPGDVVLADDNGALALAPSDAAAVVERAAASDRAEPELLRRVRGGARLSALSGADDLLDRLGHPPG